MKKIYLSDVGILPGTDITLALYKLFKENPYDTEFVFENADYYFSPHEEMRFDYRLSNSDIVPWRVLAVCMKKMKNCILRGNGARLFLEGQMQVFTIDECENITLCDFTVNWKKPLVAEGKVSACADRYLDVCIDGRVFPHRFCDGVLEFDTGADEWYRANRGLIAFDENMCVRRSTGDFFVTKVHELEKDLYRFETNYPCGIRVGDLLNIRHNSRIHAGVFAEKSTNTVVENITFHSCGGLGCLAQFCRDISFRGVNFLPDTSSGRHVSSGRDDGMHITCCSGKVTVSGCSFHALMDDPINIHGCCVTSNEVVDEYTLRCNYRHPQACGFKYWAEYGDEIAFIERGAMNRIGTAQALSYTLEDDNTFLLKFSSPIPDEILALARRGESLALDNLTNTAEFLCENNRFGSCRARGILVSTPKKVVIRNNYFESSGSAILVAGDSNYWFESGECRDVLICDNIFTSKCNSSEYEFCEGVISICPVVPKPELSKPYHKNISITRNVFDLSQKAALYGFSCQNLVFSENRIHKDPAFGRKNEDLFVLSFCTDVVLKNNEFIGFETNEPKISATNCENLDKR